MSPRRVADTILIGEIVVIATSLGLLVGMGFGIVVQITGPTLIEQIVLGGGLIASAIVGGVLGMRNGSMRERKR